MGAMDSRDVSTRTTGTPTVAPEFSNIITIFLFLLHSDRIDEADQMFKDLHRPVSQQACDIWDYRKYRSVGQTSGVGRIST